MTRTSFIGLFCATLLAPIACGDSGGPDAPRSDAAAGDGGPRIDGGGGVSRCGDDVCEGVETANNCCEDCGCGEGESCSAGACSCVARYDVTYSTDLAAEQPVCDGTSETFGPNCNAAINRWCSGRGCATTGFGPAEHSGDSADVVCLDAVVVLTSFGELGGFDGGCTSDNPYSLECNHAAHLLCAADDSTTGFGLLENGGDIAVGCTPDARLVTTTYAALSGLHPGCDGTPPGMGDSCNAAINRLCQQRGAVSGFGPVDVASPTVTVACVP